MSNPGCAMRWMLGLVGMLLCLMVGSASGQSTYRLQPGDSIAIWVSEQEGLRRQVTIGPDGWLSFPLAGHLKGEGLSLEELEAALSERLRVYFKNSVNLTIMLQPNPMHLQTIYVAGDVMTPGAFPYRAGMTVLHAISVAGGRYRAVVSATDQDRVVTVWRAIEVAQERERMTAARIKRLEAEIKGATFIDTTQEGGSDPLLAQEQVLMDARRQALATQEDARRQAGQLYGQGSAALREQVQAVERQIGLARQRYDTTARLIAKGGAEASRLIERESEIAELEGRLSQLKTEMAASDRAVVAEEARFKTLMEERKTQLLVELQEARRLQEETRAGIANSEGILAIYGQNANAGSRGQTQELAYSIIRSAGGTTGEIEATETSLVQPGDLVRVHYMSVGEAVARQTGAIPGPELPEGADAGAARPEATATVEVQ